MLLSWCIAVAYSTDAKVSKSDKIVPLKVNSLYIQWTVKYTGKDFQEYNTTSQVGTISQLQRTPRTYARWFKANYDT